MEERILTNENYFLPFCQTSINCYQQKQFFLQLARIFRYPLFQLVEDFLVYWKQYSYIPSFFLLVEAIIQSRQNQFLKANHIQFLRKKLIFASGKLIFRLVETILFSIFQTILPVIAFFPSSGNVSFNKIFHSGQLKRIFSNHSQKLLRLYFHEKVLKKCQI